jgi:hypothetical protein
VQATKPNSQQLSDKENQQIGGDDDDDDDDDGDGDDDGIFSLLIPRLSISSSLLGCLQFISFPLKYLFSVFLGWYCTLCTLLSLFLRYPLFPNSVFL